MAENKIRQRHEIPVEDTWALEDMYVNDEAWEAELATLAEDQAVLAAFAGKLGESAENLFAFLSREEQVNAKAELLANYCMRKSDQDTRNGVVSKMDGGNLEDGGAAVLCQGEIIAHAENHHGADGLSQEAGAFRNDAKNTHRIQPCADTGEV